MTRQQNKLCELMLEFNALCEKVGANYYLIGPQLLHAARDGVLHGYEMDVAMFYKDWEKVEKRIHSDENREIESVLDHGKLMGCFFRYVDKNTLLLDLDRYGMLAKPGIGIHVHIIRVPRKKSKILAFLEQGMQDCFVKKCSFARVVVKIGRVFIGRDQFDSSVLQLLKTVRAKDDDSVTELREPGNACIRFEPGYWREKTTVTVAGMNLCTVKNYQYYLSQRYSKNWIKAKSDAVLENYRCVFSATLPYAKYMTRINQERLITQAFLKRMHRYSSGYQEYKKLQAAESEGWDKSIFFSGERFRLWKKYMPLKARILSLYEAGQLDEVELLLTDYLTVLNKYLKMNMVMCFDSDLLDVVKKLYLMYGKKAIVQKINRYVLKEDLQPIEVTWRAEAEG